MTKYPRLTTEEILSKNFIGFDEWCLLSSNTVKSKYQEPISFIYQITNLKNNKIYIGQATSGGRIRSWIANIKNNSHNVNYKLRKDFISQNKNDKDFQLKILEFCEVEDLTNREEFWYNKRKKEGFKLYNSENKIGGSKPIPQLTEKQLKRFWSKVDKKSDEECWEWVSNLKNKYCGLSFNYKNYQSHIVSFVLEQRKTNSYYQIPNGQLVRHLCHNKKCCNPKHLKLGTDKDNRLDTVKEGYSKSQKLTFKKAKKIRKLFKSGKTFKEISKIFNISNSDVSSVICNTRFVDNSYTPHTKTVSSKYKGVYWNKNRKKWISEIWKDKKYYYLGSFNNEKEAAKAYNKKTIELYGLNVILNDIEK